MSQRTRTRTRGGQQSRTREMLAGTNFQLRPLYENLLDELGTPPVGVPEECQFHWPARVPDGTIIEPEKFVYVKSASELSGNLDGVTVIEVPNLEDVAVEQDSEEVE